MVIEVEKGLGGKWIIRVNGIFVEEFWREARARRLAMNLIRAHERELERQEERTDGIA